MKQVESTQSRVRVLHLEDNENDCILVREMLTAEGLNCEVHLVKTRADFERALKEQRFDIIISDYSLPSYDGKLALKLAREQQGEVPFVFFSGTIGEETAVDSLKTGATDYVVKQRPHRLVAAVRRALQEAEAKALHRKAEEKIREQADLLDKASDAIIVRDLKGRIVYWNQGAERMYGWTAREAIGQHADQLTNAGKTQLLAQARRHVLEHGEWVGEVPQTTRDGREFIVSSSWTLMHDAAGKPKSKLVINSNITAMKELEKRLHRAQRLESIGALAGGIAHDLNNILAPILMAADLLGSEIKSAESQQMLQTLHGCARRGAELVKQILSFARGIAGEAGVLQIKALVSEMTSLAKDTFPRSIRIESRIAAEVPPVVGNATQLHQVLMNLCVNARDAMPSGGLLRLTLDSVDLNERPTSDAGSFAPGRYVVLTVEDNGHGMTPEVVERVFDPFFTTKGEGKGTGLGLSTVKEIVTAHRGYVEVSSQPDSGSKFTVYLPATAIPGSTPAEETVAPPPSGNGELILVVDDELAITEMAKNTLETYNYRVISARNGAEAVTQFHRNQAEVRVIIMDMMMPIMDGPAAIETIQKASRQVRIIGTSGLESESALVRANELRVDSFLRKPYSNESLLFALKRVLTPSR